MKIIFFSTKSYDEKYFSAENESGAHELVFQEFKLNVDSAKLAEGFVAVCAFVNDQLDRPTLEALKAGGTQYIALRCAGFNNVDLEAAEELGLQVVRVPAYSPHAVADPRPRTLPWTPSAVRTAQAASPSRRCWTGSPCPRARPWR